MASERKAGMDSDYMGTLSHYDHSDRTRRELRGKYKANKRRPRFSSFADSSDCISYNVADLDEAGRPTRGTIFRPRRERKPITPRESVRVQADVLKLAHIVGNAVELAAE